MSDTSPIGAERTPEYIIEPMYVGDDLVVNNVFAQPPEESPEPRADTASHVEFTEYAYCRFDPRFNGTEPRIVTVAVQEPAHHIRRRDGWVWDITPRLSAGVFLATTAVANLSGNASSLAADAKELGAQLHHDGKQTISRWLGNEPKPITVETSKPGEVVTLELSYPQPVGESAPSESDTKNLIDQIADARSKGKTLVKITIFAGSSDERGPHESTLQVPNAGNDELDTARATDAAEQLKQQAEAAGLDLPEIQIESAESILSAEEVADLKGEAAKHGLSLEEAMAIFNDGGELHPDLQTLMQTKLGDARSVTIQVEMQGPDEITTDIIPVDEVAPENKDHDYDFYWGLPLPIFPRLRLEEYMKTHDEQWLRPGAKPDERWIELYKEALQEDGSLPRDAWRFTRKYQLLAREDRIDYVLVHNYTDANGEQRDMRVMFVDHDPTVETVEMYKRLLNDASQMMDGNLPERWSAITVFPRSQVGTDPTAGREGQSYPHHPADIGLDIDKQDPEEVLGVTMPALGLVEMHMPEDPTTQELNEYLEALWIAAHEFTGHATDTTGEPTYLLPTGPVGSRHYISTSTWNDTAQAAFDALPDSDAEGTRDFTVTRQLATREGKLVTLVDEVTAGEPPKIGPIRSRLMRLIGVDPKVQAQLGTDSRLAESQHAVLNGRKPTRYSGESAGELYGEVAAQAVSGTQIPYEESGIDVTPRHPGLGQGYGVDPGLQRMFEQRTGWSRKTARPVNQDEFTFMYATDDPVLREFIDTARRTPMPDDRITILSRVASLER